jgi:membrane associated rhomboid family serine protease
VKIFERPTAGSALPMREHHAPVATYALIGVNVLVFGMWTLSAGDPARSALLVRYLTVSSSHVVKEGLWWTLLSAAFSHRLLVHLFINMVMLWGFGEILEGALGVRRYLGFYLSAAVVSSASHCLVSILLARETPAMGASGAVSGLLVLYSVLFPHDRLLAFGIVPVRAFVWAVVFIAFDLWGLMVQGHGGSPVIGHGAHLGGALWGVLAGCWAFRGVVPRLGGAVEELSEACRAELERIRAKISSGGAASLTPDELELVARLHGRARRARQAGGGSGVHPRNVAGRES